VDGRPSHARLLDGPPPSAGPESLAAHRGRLGALPAGRDRPEIIPTLEASGLLGRGGASFPVGRKWRTVAERSAGRAVVLVNGAEGEPLSAKDRVLMALRPHLVLDGALLAARAVGAEEIVVYVGSAHTVARASIDRALAERSAERPAEPVVPVRVVDAPHRYVAGEESAAVHFVNDADARPTSIPPRPYERGIRGQPTLVQNVESLAHAALIGRFGDAWYRAIGSGETQGTALVTVNGGRDGGVHEIALGTPVSDVAARAGAARGGTQAVLLGGYFGGWLDVAEAWDLALDPTAMRRTGRAFGCGVVSFLPAEACGVRTTAGIMEYMAGQSAAQCGPCVFGLRSIADAVQRLATCRAAADDLGRIGHWSGQLAGRGACRHPDGAVGLVQSALRVFGEEFERHQRARTCSRPAIGRAA
jgi:NADH:ubiquinone oxidoreductase subunit F (NADH-binding)